MADMSARTTVHVSYPHIHVIYTYPVLDLLNKLILMFNDCDNWIDAVYK